MSARGQERERIGRKGVDSERERAQAGRGWKRGNRVGNEGAGMRVEGQQPGGGKWPRRQSNRVSSAEYSLVAGLSAYMS